jgi:hypothetical protein
LLLRYDTGAILAGGLAIGLSASELKEFRSGPLEAVFGDRTVLTLAR